MNFKWNRIKTLWHMHFNFVKLDFLFLGLSCVIKYHIGRLLELKDRLSKELRQKQIKIKCDV